VSSGDSSGGLRIGKEFALRLSKTCLGTIAMVGCLEQVGHASLIIRELT
jgi:hypothetical protein